MKEKQENAKRKTVLLVDDEQTFLEPLSDALEFEGHRVLKASNAAEALTILEKEHIDLVTIDIMLDPGDSLKNRLESQHAGVFLAQEIHKKYRDLDAFCISVVSDVSTIRTIQSLGIRFLRKGETPLRTILNMIRSRLSGIAYSTDRNNRTNTH